MTARSCRREPVTQAKGDSATFTGKIVVGEMSSGWVPKRCMCSEREWEEADAGRRKAGTSCHRQAADGSETSDGRRPNETLA